MNRNINTPDLFDRTRSKFYSYITQLRLAFSSNPTIYYDYSLKLAYAALYLTGSAANWFDPYMTPNSVDFTSFDQFVTHLKVAFDDPNTRATAKRKLLAFK